MPVQTVLLRVLLCLSLLVNGVGSAAAAVQMAWSPAAAASSATREAPAPCHGADRMDAHGAGHGHQAADPTAPDCCKQHGGGCACTLAANAVLPQSVPVIALVRSECSAVLVRGHMPPSLLDPIRPPIG